MTLQSLVNTGIRATSSVPVKKIKVELMCNETSIGSTVISLSTDRISSYTTTEMIRHLEQACSDIIGGKYVPYILFKRHNGSDTLTQISSDQEVADALSSGDDIVVEYGANETEVADDGNYKLSPDLLGSRGCPDRMLKAGGWVVPEPSSGDWRRGVFNSAVIRDMSFRNIQSNHVSIVGDSSTPKKYSLVESSRSDQSLRIEDLQAVFSSDYKWAIFAIYDRYGCNYDQILNSIVNGTDLKVGNDGVVILPPPLYWNTETHIDLRSNVVINLDDISFTAENGKTYHAVLDYNSYTTTAGSHTPTTLGWVAEGCKNFLELTHSELDILDNGTVSDLGLNELGIDVYKEVENGHNVNYIYPSYYDSEDDQEISPTPGDQVVLALPISFAGYCIWESGNAVELYQVDANNSVYVDTYYFDSTVKWFGVTKNGGSTHDTYGVGSGYGRSNANATKSKFISLLGLDQNSSDEVIINLFPPGEMYNTRISPAGYIVLPPEYNWVNPGTTVASLVYRDDRMRTFKYDSNIQKFTDKSVSYGASSFCDLYEESLTGFLIPNCFAELSSSDNTYYVTIPDGARWEISRSNSATTKATSFVYEGVTYVFNTTYGGYVRQGLESNKVKSSNFPSDGVTPGQINNVYFTYDQLRYGDYLPPGGTAFWKGNYFYAILPSDASWDGTSIVYKGNTWYLDNYHFGTWTSSGSIIIHNEITDTEYIVSTSLCSDRHATRDMYHTVIFRVPSVDVYDGYSDIEGIFDKNGNMVYDAELRKSSSYLPVPDEPFGTTITLYIRAGVAA